MPAAKITTRRPLIILGVVLILFVLVLLVLANSKGQLKASSVPDDITREYLLGRCENSCTEWYYDECLGIESWPIPSLPPDDECKYYYYLCLDQCEELYGDPDITVPTSSPTPSD